VTLLDLGRGCYSRRRNKFLKFFEYCEYMELEKSGTSKRERDEDDDITKEPKKHKGDGSFNGNSD
jgi:hypothetical protein